MRPTCLLLSAFLPVPPPLLIAIRPSPADGLALAPGPAAAAAPPSPSSPSGHPALLDALATFIQPSPEAGEEEAECDARRVFHGRGGLYPGAEHLTLDYFPPVFLLTSHHRTLTEEELEIYGNALEATWERIACGASSRASDFASSDATEEGEPLPPTIGSSASVPSLAWVYQYRAEGRKCATRIMSGRVPDLHVVTEHGGRDKFLVHLARGQNHGLFLDMAAGRSWLRSLCASGEVSSVLNLFAYTCAFSVAALNGGASTVVNVDASRGALKVGQRNHDLNGLGKGGRAKFWSHDVFKSWGKLRRSGPYDCVVVDPPSYQKGSFVASKDYGKVIRRLPSLLRPGGWALLCLNAPELGTSFLLNSTETEAPELRFVERVDNPPAFASANPERALKVMAFRYEPRSTV